MPELPAIAIPLTPTQIWNAKIIVDEFLSAGLPFAIGLAAMVNAKAESNLKADAAGDSGQSIGLFQLYSKGAGAGMTVAQRADPRKNTRRIIQEVKDPRYGSNIAAAYRAGASLAQLAGIFARDIERPRDSAGEMARRSELASRMFPGIASLAGTTLQTAGLGYGLARKIPWWGWAAGVGGVVVLGLAIFAPRKRG